MSARNRELALKLTDVVFKAAMSTFGPVGTLVGESVGKVLDEFAGRAKEEQQRLEYQMRSIIAGISHSTPDRTAVADHDIEAAVLAVADTIAGVPIDATLLREFRWTVDGLTAYYLSRAADLLDRAALGEAEQVYRRILRQVSEQVVALVRRSPEVHAIGLADLYARTEARVPEAAPPSRVGWPIGDCTPDDFRVHPTIDVAGAAADQLPGYVSRAHDARLREVVEDVLGTGGSRMVTLVGDSSTGKSRACWELARRLEERLPGIWWLWRPFDPTYPDATLAGLDRVRPHTIVWFDEVQRYLAPPDNALGERVAAGLTTLLRDRERGPVLVLATAWREHFAELTDQPEEHVQAGELLSRAVCAEVADGFTAEETAALLVPAADPRLREAADRAEGGRITQYLAGVPLVRQRYRLAGAAARALIHVAMDARRFGHPEAIPDVLLERAAQGYLRDGLSRDELTAALEYTGRDCRGVRGPLSPVTSGGRPCHRLADPLEQSGRLERAGTYPRDSFWIALGTVVEDAALLHHFARQARARSRYQHAIWLYWSAARRGHLPSLRTLADWREQAGDPDGAEAVYRQAADAGNADALWLLGEMQEDSGNVAAARALYRRAADSGSAGGMRHLGRWCERDGDRAGAEIRFRQAAEHCDAEALAYLAVLWDRNGDTAGAEALALHAARCGHVAVLRAVARCREYADDLAGAYVLFYNAASMTGDEYLWDRAHRLEPRCDGSAFERALAVQAADHAGVVQRRRVAVPEAHDDGRAEAWLQWVSRVQEIHPLAMAAQRRVRAGDLAGALAVYAPAAERGFADAIRMSGRVLELFGDTEGAAARYLDALNRGDGQAHHDLEGLWAQNGEETRARRLREFGLTADGVPATGLDFTLPAHLRTAT